MNTYSEDKMYEKYSSEVERMQKCIDDLLQENKQLKNNWNELKDYIGAEWYSYDNESVECEVAGDILDKMQEIEGSDNK